MKRKDGKGRLSERTWTMNGRVTSAEELYRTMFAWSSESSLNRWNGEPAGAGPAPGKTRIVTVNPPPGQAAGMLDELRSKKLLDGVRGMLPRDRGALIDAIVRLSWFAYDFRNEVAELDVNPVIVLEDGAGAKIVDALIVRKPGA